VRLTGPQAFQFFLEAELFPFQPEQFGVVWPWAAIFVADSAVEGRVAFLESRNPGIHGHASRILIAVVGRGFGPKHGTGGLPAPLPPDALRTGMACRAPA
jgi:hypothetical protein